MTEAQPPQRPRGSITPNPEQLRGLAHPTRLAMLGMLRLDGPQTATGLAARLGLNTGATSYHLRQLATHGFVVDDTSLGNGRERWWRAAHRSTTLTDLADENAAAYTQTVVVRHAQFLQQSAEEFEELPEEWKRASTFSDTVIRLTPQRAHEVIDQIQDLLRDVEREAECAGEDTEQVMVQLHVFPRPGVLPHRSEQP